MAARWILLMGTLLALAAPAAARADGREVVNLYSARHDALIEPLLARFTEKTGIEVGLVTASSAAMIQRIKIEGRNTPADVLLTVDVARLQRAESAGIFQSIDSAVLERAIPPHLRDPEGKWFGLSMRARVIAYSRERVDPAALSTYEALAKPRWEGRLCVTSSSNVYNQSLLASIIAAHGVEYATAWARGIVENLVRPPQGGETAQIQAVAAGICDVTIVNHYYYARLRYAEPGSEARRIASQVALYFPNQQGRGAHVNITGAGVLRYAEHKENAVKLLEFLVSDWAQRKIAALNYEYPVARGVEPPARLRALGWPFKADRTALGRIGELTPVAVRIFDRVGWR